MCWVAVLSRRYSKLSWSRLSHTASFFFVCWLSSIQLTLHIIIIPPISTHSTPPHHTRKPSAWDYRIKFSISQNFHNRPRIYFTFECRKKLLRSCLLGHMCGGQQLCDPCIHHLSCVRAGRVDEKYIGKYFFILFRPTTFYGENGVCSIWAHRRVWEKHSKRQRWRRKNRRRRQQRRGDEMMKKTATTTVCQWIAQSTE